MVKLGDRGPEVSRAQKLLSLLGYDLIVDGDFGKRTARSLKAFQKKYGLVIDGIAGPNTFIALEAAQKRTSKEEKAPSNGKDYGDLEVEKMYHLDPAQYIRQKHKKTQIFIHYTAGGPSAKNVIKYWDGNATRVATAYVIHGRDSNPDKDGLVHECHNPDHWGFHLGIKGTNGRLDKVSVGIEVCAWGRLDKVGDTYKTYVKTTVPEDEVIELDEKWRGNKFYHTYSEKQLENLEKLLLWIIKEYDIPVQESFDKSWAEYNPDVIKKTLPGIWTHTTVRKDKQDTHPDPRIFEMLNRISRKVNG